MIKYPMALTAPIRKMKMRLLLPGKPEATLPVPRVVRSGTEYFDLLLEMMAAAKTSIHLQTYILADDETGQRVANGLMEAAQRGVEVYVVADGYASQQLSASYLDALRQSGVHFRFFDPIWKSKFFYFGRRLHHKVVVVDGKAALVGGINIANHYNVVRGSLPWLDYALYVEGSVAFHLERICEARAEGFFAPGKMASYPVMIGPTGTTRILINDWVRGKKQITKSYAQMLRNTTSSITLLSSYFLPGEEFRKHLRIAAKRGIRIRLIVAGISDVRVAKYAERYMYHWLLRNGVEIYEYQRQVLHGKLAVADGRILTIGSYNINNISARASIELNLEVQNQELARQLDHELQTIIDRDCMRITWDRYQYMSTFIQRVLQRASYDLFRGLLFLFTFYFKQRE